MWSRFELKSRAKTALSSNYFKALAIAIVIILSGGHDIYGTSGNGNNDHTAGFHVGFFNIDIPLGFHNPGFSAFYTFVFLILLRIFIGYSLTVGGRRFFIKLSEGNNSDPSFRFSFDKDYYLKIIATMFLKDVYNFLWYLLFIIPGIVKGYAYRMVPYILAEHPEMESSEVIHLSQEMTQGHKWNMFILDLSFIGWYFLGALAFGIGMVFVLPYEYATKAELYQVLKREYFN